MADNQYYKVTNKKVIGKFKDECNSVPIAEFIGLRPKMFSIQKSDLNEICKAKGVVGTVVKKNLHMRSLQESKWMTHTHIVIRSHEDNIAVYEQNKVNINLLDTKNWIASDGVTTLAYGHYRII